MKLGVGGIFLIAVIVMPVVVAAQAGGLFLNPASGSFFVGSTFDLSIVLDTKGVAVNTVEIELLFPPDKLQVATPSVGQSIIQLWPAPPTFSNREGRIYFVGGIPSPGIVTSQGVVLTLTFRVIAPGDGNIRFGEATSILANDGQGTNIIGTTAPAFLKFSVPPPQGPAIYSPTHPDQEKWYRDPNPTFVWDKSKFADGYSYAMDTDPSGFADTTIESAEATASFEDLSSGFWYFHLRERAGGVWGGISHYLVKIDRDLPADFQLDISPRVRTTNRNPIIRFFSTDSLSGLDHFAMKIIPLTGNQAESEALLFEVTSPYQAPGLDSGRYQVLVRAFDQAGNTRDASTLLTILGPGSEVFSPEGLNLFGGLVFISWPLAMFIGGLLLFFIVLLVVLLWRRHHHHVTTATAPTLPPAN